MSVRCELRLLGRRPQAGSYARAATVVLGMRDIWIDPHGGVYAATFYPRHYFEWSFDGPLMAEYLTITAPSGIDMYVEQILLPWSTTMLLAGDTLTIRYEPSQPVFTIERTAVERRGSGLDVPVVEMAHVAQPQNARRIAL